MEWDKKERTQNALKAVGMWFGFTCFGVMIPVVHYFLVPTLFITTWVMGLNKLNETVVSEGGEGICPKCGQTFKIEKSKFGARLTDSCGKCHEDVEILFEEVAHS